MDDYLFRGFLDFVQKVIQRIYCPFQATWPRDLFTKKKTTQLRSTISPQRLNRIHRKGHRWTRKISRKTIIAVRAVKDNFLSYRFFRVQAFIVQKFTDHQRSADMAQGQKIHPQVQWAIIRLSKLLKNDQIAMCLDLSTRSVRRVLSHFSVHGTIPYPEEEAPEKRRGKSHLRDVDVDVSIRSKLYDTPGIDI